MKALYQENKERDLANSRKYYKEHGKALRKLPKKEKQFSVDEGAYQKEHEKFFNEEFIFVIRERAKEKREYDPIATRRIRKKYYDSHRVEITARNHRFYLKNRDKICEAARIKRDGLSTEELAVVNKEHNEYQRKKRRDMSDEQWEVKSIERREKYRLRKGGEVRPHRRGTRKKLK